MYRLTLLTVAVLTAMPSVSALAAFEPQLILSRGGSVPGEQLGSFVAGVGDLNGDGYGDIAVRSTPPTGDRVEIFLGGAAPDTVPDLILQEELPNSSFGACIAGAGDVNDDGFDDLIVGAPSSTAGGSAAGRAYVFFGGPVLDDTPDLVMTGETWDELGLWVSGAGDVNDDGFDDFLIGAPQHCNGSWQGKAFLYLGGAAPDTIPDLSFRGEGLGSINCGDYFGARMSRCGDFNNDGFDDFMISDHHYSYSTGRVYIYFGGAPLDTIPDLVLTGSATGDGLGFALDSGDFNGDGIADLLVTASREDAGAINAGAAYLYFGGTSPDDVPDVRMTGTASYVDFGWDAASAGDLDGDGFDDFMVEDRHSVTPQFERTHVYRGGAPPDTTTDALFSFLAGTLYDPTFVRYNCPTYRSSAGDFDGDGLDDILLSATSDSTNGFASGRVFVYSFRPRSALGIPGDDTGSSRLVLAVRPNPARATARISLDLSRPALVTLRILDVQGRMVAQPLKNRFLEAGPSEVELDSRRLSPGVYFISMVAAPGRTYSGKFVVTR